MKALNLPLLLWVVPIAVAVVSLRYAPNVLWRNTGVALGLIVSPASQGLYALYFVGPLAAIAGMVGLVLTMLHGWPGYHLSIAAGLIPSRTVITGAQLIAVEGFNALIWAGVYGGLGWVLDGFRGRRTGVRRNAV